jgi:peptidoglycan/xylan/chitin deacetylase (PgdA/CDA1 family)
MAFPAGTATRTVTHTWVDPDTGAPCAGEVEFELLTRVRAGETTIVPDIIVGTLDESGTISLEVLVSSADAQPPRAVYRLTQRITPPGGKEWRKFDTVYVPEGDSPLDLEELLPVPVAPGTVTVINTGSGLTPEEKALLDGLPDRFAEKADTADLEAEAQTRAESIGALADEIEAGLAGKADSGDLGVEITARSEADTALAGQIAAGLASKAESADLAAETSARTTAIANLATQTANSLAAKADSADLTAEAGTRAAADEALGNDLASGLAAKADAADLATETGARAAADEALGNDLASGLAAKANAADLATETGARTAGDAARYTKAEADQLVSDARAEAIRTSARTARGAVVFTWDDGWSQHPLLAQMHAARGQRATFYITTGLLGTSQHLNAADVTAIWAMGHEIGAHNVNHVSMLTLNPATRQPEWDQAKATLEGLTAPGAVTSYAYPLGANDATTNTEAHCRYDRVADIGLTQNYNRTPWLIERGERLFKHGRFPWNQTSHAQLLETIRSFVVHQPVVLPVYAHQPGNPDTPTLAQVTEAMDLCAQLGIPCLTASEALPGPYLANPGFEASLNGWTVLTAGAGGTAQSVADAPSAGLPGTNSLRIDIGANPVAGTSVSVFQIMRVQGGTSYTVGGRIRHANLTGTGKYSLRINEYDKDGTAIASKSLRGTASTTDWALQTMTAVTDPLTKSMRCDFYAQDVGGQFYADHAFFGPTAEGNYA